MKRAIVALLLLGAPAPLAAQDAPAEPPTPPAIAQPAAPAAVVVRQTVEPPAGAVIGQHITLNVDVLFRGDMPRPPRVSLPAVPGLQTFRFESQGTTISETIDGARYNGQRFGFALYPRRGGRFDIPPAVVTLLDRQGGDAGKADGREVTLEVSVPDGVDASQPVVATRKLTLAEDWAPDPRESFDAGDAIVRTITRTAEDVSGLAMRDLAFPAPEGVRVYADPPDIEDRSNRGVVTGQRRDRVTYVFVRGGTVVLPAVAQPWWDLAAGALRTEQAPGATITVAAAPIAAPARADAWRSGLALAVAAGLAAVLVGAWLVLRRRRAQAPGGEPAAFAALRRACGGGDARTVYDAFAIWCGCLTAERRAVVAQAAAPLSAALFAGKPAAWSQADGARLVERLTGIRRSWSAPAALPALAALNPAGPLRPEHARSRP
ncbi:BatD family protein [Chelatococcus asaccharovorans]|uniref:Oxygen tolerance protein BatD n=1 Tax=Chelatococcus asaccharovorans TaxID=28210 RepID=A0A2V3U178_9HYPH|nr:BatD family protein [Chelatococcus asaccharovorans]MBS7704361.1 BatD family protein [Chelatococcus asaccharovorans]PXW55761.1 oxygen tolerance protein BatD [Chelatococcus asaccharovorans]